MNAVLISFAVLWLLSAIPAEAADTHDISISSITAPEYVDAGADFDVTVAIKNRGTVREDSIEITLAFNKKTYSLKGFSIAPGNTTEVAFRLQAPDSAGTYTIETHAGNGYDFDMDRTSVKVNFVFVSLSLSKSSAAVNEWVDVSGYATRNGVRSAGTVLLYRNGMYIGEIIPAENGYYSTRIKFPYPGTHTLAAIAGTVRQEQTIYISASQTPPAPEEITVPSNYTAIIVVTADGSKTIYPTYVSPRGKYEGFSFIDAELSAKELDAVQYRGNTLKVTITNHLGRSGRFGIGTDFDEKWVFSPKTDVLEDGTTADFELYISPNETGRFDGNIYVSEGKSIVKTLPVSLFVSPAPAQKKENAWLYPASLIGGTAAFAALAIIGTAAIYFGMRKAKTLEPLNMPPVFEKTEAPAPGGKKDDDFFSVPLRNIIM